VKKLLLLLLVVTSLFAQKMQKPDYIFKTADLVTDVITSNMLLYAANDAGSVDVFDIKSKKRLKHIELSKIKDFMGDEIDSKIFSIDILDNELLILSQDSGGYSRVEIYRDEKLESVISKDERLNIIKAKYIDSETILLALISNDIISYNIKSKKMNWSIQASMSKFSNFALNHNKSRVAIADESGDVHIISTKDGKIVDTLKGENVDNIFAVDFSHNVVITGGQDRRVGVYHIGSSNAYHKTSNFFVYGVGLSPSGKIAAYSCDMDNNIELFNSDNGESIGKFSGNKKVVNSIYFLDEKSFFINSADKEVRYFKLK